MKKNRLVTRILILFITLMSLGQHSKAQSSLDKKTLVTIGDDNLSVGEFMRVYEKNNSQTSVQDPSTIEDYLDLFINFKLKFYFLLNLFNIIYILGYF